jgi:hypothetical protein
VSSFPPEDIRSFLNCCAGEWLTLRSRFAAGEAAPPEADDEGWHRSERGELVVTYLPPQQGDDPGGLAITPPAVPGEAGLTRHLIFSAEGRFRGGMAGKDPAAVEVWREGTWLLRPDGSLELTLEAETAVVHERIWFTKPNLRLRSSVEHRRDGRPGGASFSSEIRRVAPPTTPRDDSPR